MKVLYAASEAYPFAMSGGLADVAGALPKALRRRLVGCRVIMPLYSSISEDLKKEMTFITSITVPVSWRRQYCGVFEARKDGVIYYFIDNQYYFKREGLYGHFDDAERYAFFSRAVLEVLPAVDFKPDIIHCNDWQTALIPVYLDSMYRDNEFYSGIKTVFTVHNIQYQGKYGHEILGDVLGMPQDKEHLLEYDGCVNFMKGAFATSNRITTVSPTYAHEILDPYYSFGLDPILREMSGKLTGIVNGIDYDVYNPETDPMIYKNFSIENMAGKTDNKLGLQEELGLPKDPDVAVIGMVSRLVNHKGFDLVKHVFEEIAQSRVQIVILGSGEWEYENFFREMQKKFPDKVAFRSGFIPALAHKIYAGADIFLMPSKSEPCGLAQLVALRYGTVPVVRQTGGLNDTIVDSGDGIGNGFTFGSYNAHDMEHAVWRALEGYYDTLGWEILRTRAMKCDNSWAKSAGEYIKLYKSLLK
ncbi:MAG: glycogen synthase GlgA [Clostridiales bacterium]|nr:glycogen synthase GlgA [Candidatus Equinaster intestinalis]